MEFAVLAPLLFVLLFGIIEFARLGFAFTEVWSAAREGARYATTVGDSGGTVGVPNYVDCAGIRDSALHLVVTQALASTDIAVTYRDASGSVLADCDPSTGTIPDPSTAGTIDSSTRIEVSVHGVFDGIAPLVGAFLDGTSLDSSQVRSVHLGVVND